MGQNSDVKSIKPGILSCLQIELLRSHELIDCERIGSSSVDLRLSHCGWIMKGCVKPCRDETFDVVRANRDLVESDISLAEGQLLEQGKTYVVQLKEHVKLDKKDLHIHGMATGKSSIGRLDVLTRLICDRCDQYDTVPEGYNGPLYVEITPITFPIWVKEGVCLNQLRLFRGEPSLSVLPDDYVRLINPFANSSGDKHNLTLELAPTSIGNKKAIAFKASRTQFESGSAVDLTSTVGKLEPKGYWEIVPPVLGKRIRIEKDHFYILRSKERFTLPDDVGVYCRAITENLGEIRIHYAGFVHPGFGHDRSEGTPLIFEVRGHSVDAFLRDGELMAKIDFYRTSEPVTPEVSGYEEQELKLSKYFDMDAWNK